MRGASPNDLTAGTTYGTSPQGHSRGPNGSSQSSFETTESAIGVAYGGEPRTRWGRRSLLDVMAGAAAVLGTGNRAARESSSSFGGGRESLASAASMTSGHDGRGSVSGYQPGMPRPVPGPGTYGYDQFASPSQTPVQIGGTRTLGTRRSSSSVWTQTTGGSAPHNRDSVIEEMGTPRPAQRFPPYDVEGAGPSLSRADTDARTSVDDDAFYTDQGSIVTDSGGTQTQDIFSPTTAPGSSRPMSGGGGSRTQSFIYSDGDDDHTATPTMGGLSSETGDQPRTLTPQMMSTNQGNYKAQNMSSSSHKDSTSASDVNDANLTASIVDARRDERDPGATRTRSRTPEDLPPELVLEIVKNLSLKDYHIFGQAFPRVRPVTSTEAARRLTVLVAPYVSSVPAFVAELKNAGGVISGSVVVHVLNGGDWTPGDLDVIVPNKDGYASIKAFLETDGFEERQRDIEAYSKPGATQTEHFYTLDYFWLVKTDDKNAIIYSVDVMVPRHLTPEDSILLYHSTTPMNYYSPHKEHIVCLFPEYFLNFAYVVNQRGVLRTAASEKALAKYRARGYEPHEKEEQGKVMPSGAFVPRRKRHVLDAIKDKKTWRVKCVI
ncbi:hypothetical protein MNV49_001581 [Pseudohyphozyma bogoriensis]|nr:hypothetical protein MNV49_001581 [Pseudohyphozyma bogoriensis]